MIESLCQIIIMAQDERIQELEDEINRLKGEKGKPKFTPKKEKKPPVSDRKKMESNTKPDGEILFSINKENIHSTVGWGFGRDVVRTRDKSVDIDAIL